MAPATFLHTFIFSGSPLNQTLKNRYWEQTLGAYIKDGHWERKLGAGIRGRDWGKVYKTRGFYQWSKIISTLIYVR
jgi:hypothetical protein